jgi:hypothetical protein
MQPGHRQNTGSLQGKNNHIWDGISGSCPTGELSQEGERVTQDTYSFWKCSRHGFLHQRMNANGSDTK